MWLITHFGFFSVVQKPGDNDLTIRARVKADLEALRDRYLSDLGEIIEGAGSDYRYRARVSHENLGQAMKQIALDIDYPNFKSHVAEVQGHDRALVYGKVWTVLDQLKD